VRTILCVALLLSSLTAHGNDPPPPAPGEGPGIRIGSKKFTESVIVGEAVAGLVRDAGFRAVHRRELGGTRVLWNALVRGEIDVYPEYTGTIVEEIFAREGLRGEDAVREALERRGIRMTASLGFRNNYAIGMREETCRKLGIRTLSDLRKHPGLVLGLSHEFMDRRDGWPGLSSRYRLPQKRVFGMDHDLAYRALAAGSIDATDVYTTDAEIAYYHLRTLDDDLRYFPVYTAVLLYRADLGDRAPDAVAAMKRLEGTISEAEMIRMNELAKIRKVPETAVAGDFLAAGLSVGTTVPGATLFDRLWKMTREHLYLVAVSLLAAIVVSIPLGILADRRPAWGPMILGVVGTIQTVPSLALLVFMIPLLGIGGPPAILALFLYSLLPIVRNTYTGLRNIPPSARESAEALGLPDGARLRRIELPMASRDILAGIKTSAVINVGTATLGALIGAGGYGQPILTGIRLDDMGLILQGAVPAALLALLVQGAFGLLERVVVPKGLRLKAAP
jgi:osmoprotectant transport system permease protein